MNNIIRPTALVTGGATRLGLAFANSLAQAGYDIALHYNGSASAADLAAKNIESLGVACTTFQADLSEPNPEGLVGKVLEAHSNLTVLINSASVYDAATISNTNIKTLQKQFAVNFFAPFLLTQAFAKGCSARLDPKGVVINILDNKISFQQYSYASYLLSKKSLAEFTRLAAIEYAPHIRVNAIAPGVILPGSERTSGYLAWRVEGIPLKMQGKVDHLLTAMNYLLENEFVTGQILTVDGGEGIDHQGLNAEQFNKKETLQK
jgi:pteridine reductase|tara:strand:- start:18759 stop:19547 length:789 start_codon:yes stop_codon:yes gene_type:complete